MLSETYFLQTTHWRPVFPWRTTPLLSWSQWSRTFMFWDCITWLRLSICDREGSPCGIVTPHNAPSNGFKSIVALKCNAYTASRRLCVEHQRIKGRLLICGTAVHFCRNKRLSYRSWRKRNYIVLLGSLFRTVSSLSVVTEGDYIFTLRPPSCPSVCPPVRPIFADHVAICRLCSPEHEVFMGSCCCKWLFIVRRRVSWVVNGLSVDILENPIVLKICQNVCLGNI